MTVRETINWVEEVRRVAHRIRLRVLEHTIANNG
mgnify:FL=1